MQADWSVACGADDPVVVVPWSDATGSIAYVDLRRTPTAIDRIPEATQYPCMAAALTRWNRPDSPLFSAKCDVWSYAVDAFAAEDLPNFTHAHASYIDLISADPRIFSDFAASERQLRTWTAYAESIAIPEGRCEWTLRPAHVLAGPSNEAEKSGYATTLYVWGYGVSPEDAAVAWCAALGALAEPVIRRLSS
jgi:hypothetical protein